MKHLDLFSGIGGFALATEMVWPDVEHTFCDNEPFAQAILKKHWPEAKIYDDIKELRTPPSADLVTGGFPCQPFSSAGKRRGTEDDRHLWPEMLRVIQLAKPRWVIGENVSGLLTWNGGMVLDEVFVGLESAGYEVWPFVLPAIAVGAPHRRDRVWIVAHRISDRGRERRTERTEPQLPETLIENSNASNSDGQRRQPRGSKGTDTKQPLYQSVGHDRHEVRSQLDGGNKNSTNTKRARLERSREERTGQYGLGDRERGHQRASWEQDWAEVATSLCALDDGLSNGLARPQGWRNAALKGAGNAIVPQVAAEIMRAISTIDPLMV